MGGRLCCGILPLRSARGPGAYGSPDDESDFHEGEGTEGNVQSIERKPRRALSVLDHSCAYVCVVGMCLMAVAALAMLPAALMFTVNEEVDNVFISEGESLIKDQGVAYIQDILLDLDIPDLSGSKDVSKIGTVHYELSDFEFLDLQMNPDHTDFDVGLTTLKIDAKKIKASIEFKWEYSADVGGLFTLTDSGRALATTNNAEMVTKFELKDGKHGEYLKVTGCDLTLKDFDVQVDADADWLYSFLIGVLHDEAVGQIETQVCENILGREFEL